MAVFARQQATAQKLIKKNGIAGVLRRTEPATPDPLKPWIQLPATTIELPVFVVVFPFDESRSSQKTASICILFKFFFWPIYSYICELDAS